MASFAGGGGGLTSVGIALGGYLCPRWLLQREEQGDMIHICIAQIRHHRFHRLVLALAVLIGLHRSDEVFRLLPGETRCSGDRTDTRLAMTPDATRRRGLP